MVIIFIVEIPYLNQTLKSNFAITNLHKNIDLSNLYILTRKYENLIMEYFVNKNYEFLS